MPKPTPPLPEKLPEPPPEKLPERAAIEKLVGDALREDIGDGDITAALINQSTVADARLLCRESAVLCGVAWFEETFRQVDDAVQIHWLHRDGDCIEADAVVCEIKGRARAILSAERTAINFLQTLSGTATTARQYADAVAGTGTRVVDTRKTIPALRRAQKYAVAVGGAHNHRMGLFDQILIKENHIAAAGSVAEAVRRARAAAADHPHFPGIEIEVESPAQLQQALDAGADRILLDNFDLAAMREGVALTRGRAELEASGNVSPQTVREIAQTGVDYISIGALTKHLRAIDFSLRFDRP